MRDQDFIDIANDLVKYRDAIENAQVSIELQARIDNHLILLDTNIDFMGNDKTQHDYDLIRMAYHLYRLKDKIR